MEFKKEEIMAMFPKDVVDFLRMNDKKRDQFYVKSVSNLKFEHSKKFCRMVECTVVGKNFSSTARYPTGQKTRKHVNNIRKRPKSRIK